MGAGSPANGRPHGRVLKNPHQAVEVMRAFSTLDKSWLLTLIFSPTGER